jgi:hypothetical protein
MLKFAQYAPLGLLCAYVTKVMILGASLSDGLVVAVIAGLTAFMLHKTEQKKFEALETQIKALSDEMAIKNKDIDAIKNHVTGLKLGQQIRVQR